MIILGFILIAFTVFFIVINETMEDKIDERMNLQLKEIARIVQEEIILASKSSDGYKREFNIPTSLNGINYQINVTDGMIYIRTEDLDEALSLRATPIIGDVRIGENIIKKQGGQVILNS
ncbi:MAG: hypothetical protein WC867_01590 [Candidatus Pacearchaeota archaeon]